MDKLAREKSRTEQAQTFAHERVNLSFPIADSRNCKRVKENKL